MAHRSGRGYVGKHTTLNKSAAYLADRISKLPDVSVSIGEIIPKTNSSSRIQVKIQRKMCWIEVDVSQSATKSRLRVHCRETLGQSTMEYIARIVRDRGWDLKFT